MFALILIIIPGIMALANGKNCMLYLLQYMHYSIQDYFGMFSNKIY